MIRGKSFFTIFFSLLDDHHPISWQMPKTPAISQRANWKAHVIEKKIVGRDTNTIRAWFYFHFKNRTLPDTLPHFYIPLFLLSLIQLKRGFDEPKPTLKFMISKRDFPMLPCGDNFQIHLNPTYPWKINASTELILFSFFQLTYGCWTLQNSTKVLDNEFDKHDKKWDLIF